MEYVNKLHQIGTLIHEDFQTAVFERGLLEHMEGVVYTLTEIQRSRNGLIDFKYITTSLVNRELFNKTE